MSLWAGVWHYGNTKQDISISRKVATGKGYGKNVVWCYMDSILVFIWFCLGWCTEWRLSSVTLYLSDDFSFAMLSYCHGRGGNPFMTCCCSHFPEILTLDKLMLPCSSVFYWCIFHSSLWDAVMLHQGQMPNVWYELLFTIFFRDSIVWWAVL